MWRASLDILDFLPLTTVDYSGGMIITDWYAENNSNEFIKISIRFLDNTVAAQNLKIIIHKKVCNNDTICSTSVLQNSKIEQELISEIVKKAARLEIDSKNKKKIIFIMERINFQVIEKKWQKRFESQKLYNKNDKAKKFYCLEMFPYPSGKIHMGHVRNYTIGDVIARYKFMNGFNVLHPMGWDSFGLPAENASKANNLHPKDWTNQNIKMMKTQLKMLGLSIDWDLEISTCDKDYYKHQQEIFIDFYNHGLVSRKETYVNWDPVEKTVLANEQVINGKGWRSNAIVERKNFLNGFLILQSFQMSF